MTLLEWMKNPMGKGESSLPNRELMIKGLDDKYNSLVQKKGDYIIRTTYYDPRTKDYYTHLVIPTDSERDNTYDVVFRFIYDPKDKSGSTSLKSYEVQFFTNSPGFAFTFAYVYNSYGLLVPVLAKKFSRQMLVKPTAVRNRFEIVGYDKLLYYGAKYLLSHDQSAMNTQVLSVYSKRYNQAVLQRNVRSVTQILDEIDGAKGRLAIRKKAAKNQEKINDPKKASIKRSTSGVKKPKMSTLDTPVGKAGKRSSNSSTRRPVKRLTKHGKSKR